MAAIQFADKPRLEQLSEKAAQQWELERRFRLFEAIP
jgi:hypothetical protein